MCLLLRQVVTFTLELAGDVTDSDSSEETGNHREPSSRLSNHLKRCDIVLLCRGW